MQRVLSTVTLLGLLVATAAAFAITEHLKLEKSPISGALVTKEFSPACSCSTDKASIRIKLRHSDWLTVTIEDSSRHTIDTLATHLHRPKGYSTFLWDGKTDAGGKVSAGSFQPEVKLQNARKTILLPNQIVVDTVAPKVLSASAGQSFLVPRANDTVAIRYVFGGKAHPVVYLHGKRIILGHHSRARGVVKWNGRRFGVPLRAGRYVLQIGAVDLAGNVTPPSGRQQVVIVLRDIALTQTPVHVSAGARFSVGVQTAAATYRWRLAGKHGTGHGKVLHLRAPSHHGDYRLVVTENGHSASAAVIVRRK